MSTVSSPFDASGGTTATANDVASTSRGVDYKGDSSSPAHATSVPSNHVATSPAAAARNGVTPPVANPNNNYVYFTTDMANQACLDIEREKHKFDTLVKWYHHHKDDIPALGTSRGNSTASSSADPTEKGSSTPMSSQPSSHQSGTSGAANSGLNGFAYSPFDLNEPGSVDPLVVRDEPVDIDDLSATLNLNDTDATPKAASGSLKRKSSDDDEPTSSKHMKMDALEETPLRRLERMSANQMASSAAPSEDVKKDERTMKMEKLDGIQKSLDEEACREAHMKRMQACGANPSFPSPGHYPMPPMGAPTPFPPMQGAGGPPQFAGPYSAGAYPPMGPTPPFPQFPPGGGYPGMQQGYPMSAPPKMPFASPAFPPNGAMPPMMRPPMPPMHPMQHQQWMAHMQAQHMAQMKNMSPNVDMKPTMDMKPSPMSPFPPGHPMSNPAMFHHHQMMMMRHHQATRGMPPMQMPPTPPFGAYPPNMMPPDGMPGPGGPPPHILDSTLMFAKNSGMPDGASMPMFNGAGMMPGMPSWQPQLTPHYPPSSFGGPTVG